MYNLNELVISTTYPETAIITSAELDDLKKRRYDTLTVNLYSLETGRSTGTLFDVDIIYALNNVTDGKYLGLPDKFRIKIRAKQTQPEIDEIAMLIDQHNKTIHEAIEQLRTLLIPAEKIEPPVEFIVQEPTPIRKAIRKVLRNKKSK